MAHSKLIKLLVCAILFALGSCGKAPNPPMADIRPVTDTLHGIPIVDNYRWLEDGDNSEVQEWANAQDEYCRSILANYKKRDYIAERVNELMKIGSLGKPMIYGERHFYNRRDAGQNQAVYYYKDGLDGDELVALDPNGFSEDGTVALDYFIPSPDGKLVAYGKSSSGTENSVLYVLEVESGKHLTDTIPNARSSSVAWINDNSGFYYNRYPNKGDVPEGDDVYYRKIYYHTIGDDYAKDALVFGEGRDKTEWNSISTSPDNEYLIVTIWLGWSKSEIFVKKRGSKGGFKSITQGIDDIFIAYPSSDGFFIMTNHDAPRYKVMYAPYSHPGIENWKTVVPESEAILTGLGISKDFIVVNTLDKAHSKLAVYNHDGKFVKNVDLPEIGSVFTHEEYEFGASLDNNNIVFGFYSFFVPPRLYQYNIDQSELNLIDEIETDLDLSGFTAKQVWYASNDGTQISMFVVFKKGIELDGSHPTVLYGYGGFNTNETPYFSRTRTMFLNDGGIVALPNLRGGGEYGEEWHRAGMLEQKQNTFDDFIAAAEWLINNKYTRPNKLMIEGGSNGGLLVGAAMIQRPELFKAVICSRPLLDMLRYQKFLIGSLWIPEYGSADNQAQFEYLYEYSPYHHVKDNVVYPSVLFSSADHDTRVDPNHVRKMTALMQAMPMAKNPVLMRMQRKTGHGQGAPVSIVIEELIDEYCFTYWQLGMR